MINKAKKRYMGGMGHESDDIDEPFLDFKSIFLSKYFTSYWIQLEASKLGYDPALCCASFESVRKLCDMLRPYLLAPTDYSPRHKGEKVKDPDKVWVNGKEVVTTEFIERTISNLTKERMKIYTSAYTRQKRMEFMDDVASLYSIASRYFNRMGIGLTELSTADIKFGIDEDIRFE